MKRNKLFKSMLILVAAVAFTACSKSEGEAQAADDVATASTYNTQFDFVTQRLDGSELRLSDWQGKVVIVNMWDTWCPPCRMEIPDFIELYDEYEDDGFVMIGLAFARDGQAAVEQFVKENNVDYINGYINQDVLNKLGQPRGIPTTFVFDQNGNVYEKYTGYREKSVFEDDIKNLLSASI
jgi:cytochrome c biogenesis protein CcmG/thiol:disulfide interchange protein DsbE